MVITTDDCQKDTLIMEDKIKKTRIREIFQTMEYGESFEKLENALEWIKTKESTFFAYVENSEEAPNGITTQIKNCVNGELLCTLHVPQIDTIKEILSKSNRKIKWIDTKPLERAHILNKLAAEIERNADILAQIEIVSRGILGRDTKNKAIPLLAQYFYFYSAFAVKLYHEDPTWSPEGMAVGVISNENILSNLGLMLAPALAAGYNIVLQVGTKLYPSIAFILDLATEVGIPKEVLRLIPSNDGEFLPYLSSDNVTILSLFVDLHNEKYLGFNNFNKRILNLSSARIPMIVFDDADLDSSSASVIDSAWGYGGLMPWPVNTILVQENIFEAFLNKLKSKLRLVKVGLGNNKSVDISCPSQESVDKLNELVKLAKLQGIEVFQVEEHSNSFSPTLFIGGKVQTNRVLSADEEYQANVVTVLTFRSIDEAVNLADNTRQGLAASIWSENTGLVNEVGRKLKVSNVWINSHGLTSPKIVLSPIKDSGAGYFSAEEGFFEYLHIKKKVDSSSGSSEPQKLNSALASVVLAAKKSQESWSRVPEIEKSKLLQQFAGLINTFKKTCKLYCTKCLKDKYFSSSLSDKWLDDWIDNIYDCITSDELLSYNSSLLGFNVTSWREPRGVVAIETAREFDSHNIKLILCSLFLGNSVILLNNSKSAESFYIELSKLLPSGVLHVVRYNLDNVKTLAVHKEIKAYCGDGANPVFALLPLKDYRVFANVLHDWDDVHMKVSYTKNIWFNVGKSITYSVTV